VAAYADVFESTAAVTTGRTRRGPGGAVLAVCGTPDATLNVVISPEPDPTPDEIASLAESESWDLPWSIQVRGVPGPSVTEVAARHGLTQSMRMPLMVRRPEQGLPAEPVNDSLRVRPVRGDELDLLAATATEGFEAPPEVFQYLTQPSAARVVGFTYYLAELGDVPVGTGMTVTSGDLTGVYLIATLPRYRQRGYGRAVTVEMIRAGFVAGAPTAYLYAGSEAAVRVYESVGFRTEEYLTVITAPPGSAGRSHLLDAHAQRQRRPHAHPERRPFFRCANRT
jgi:ribosomal protein S18 acetylase RimI-like enzyme